MTQRQSYIDQLVRDAPPLTSEQRSRVSAAFERPGTQSRPARTLTLRCAVYRYWDDDDVLLYVGISLHPESRGRAHFKTSIFHEFATRQEVIWADSEDHARRLERIAIEDEMPLFNTQHASPDRDARLTEYLVRKQAWHLLRPASIQKDSR